MHYTISYEGLTGATRRTKALRDVRDYMGRESYDRVTKVMQDSLGPKPKLSAVRFTLRSINMMVGVQGYPAIAWVVQAVRQARN